MTGQFHVLNWSPWNRNKLHTTQRKLKKKNIKVIVKFQAATAHWRPRPHVLLSADKGKRLYRQFRDEVWSVGRACNRCWLPRLRINRHGLLWRYWLAYSSPHKDRNTVLKGANITIDDWLLTWHSTHCMWLQKFQKF